jgi:WD40 repeat protein
MRTKNQIHALTGHLQTVTAIETLPVDPQIITASADTTVKLWDIVAGKTFTTLTHHKKGVRSLKAHPTDAGFVSGSTDNIKQWRLPKGNFLQNLEGHHSIINSMSINQDNVLFTGGILLITKVIMDPCTFGIGRVVIIFKHLKRWLSQDHLKTRRVFLLLFLIVLVLDLLQRKLTNRSKFGKRMNSLLQKHTRFSTGNQN